MTRTLKILALLVLAAVVVAAAFAIYVIGRDVYCQRLYKHETRILWTMYDIKPADCRKVEWDNMVGWTLNLHTRCRFGADGFSIDAHRRYTKELEGRLNSGRFGVDDINWIWMTYKTECPRSATMVDNNLPTTPEVRAQANEFGLTPPKEWSLP
jgi:hypothetical protein